MNNELKIARHIASRGTNALLAIESIGLRASEVLGSETLTKDKKLELLGQLNAQLMDKVMEGTSSLYTSNKSFDKNPTV